MFTLFSAQAKVRKEATSRIFDYNIDASATTLLANMTNLETPNSNSYLPLEDYNSLTSDAKELWRKLNNDMRSILLKGRNATTNSDINSVNRFNKTKSNECEFVMPLSCKGKHFARANLHEFLSDLFKDNDAYEDADAGIEDSIEVNESEFIFLVNSTLTNNINPGDIRKLMSATDKVKPISVPCCY